MKPDTPPEVSAMYGRSWSKKERTCSLELHRFDNPKNLFFRSFETFCCRGFEAVLCKGFGLALRILGLSESSKFEPSRKTQEFDGLGFGLTPSSKPCILHPRALGVRVAPTPRVGFRAYGLKGIEGVKGFC